ncbi:unnamed protein product [Penicillium olsonii]|uniref:Uncharacterized protein n=1 Tax=Penicillium olsonii TaxID=99116 RepID=A0A9W4HPJ8_PENOL|nr:unnamed protein product [Penicillium olsonii]CAG8078923.1 unnamed protein product [Penicillium olsonii]
MSNAKISSPSQPQPRDDLPTTFSSQGINLETFHRLLSCYEATVSQVHRRKALLKLQPKKGPKGKSATSSIPKTDLTASEETQVREQTDKFLELDRWRYDSLPKAVLERKTNQSTGSEGALLLKEELVSIMDWKMKHGVFRPALMGMIKGNPDKTVTQATSAAFASLPDADPSAPLAAFPKSSLDALTAPLRGVGPATASLILSIGTGLGHSQSQVPFYSDDVYLWLVLNDLPESADQEDKPSVHKKPSGELIAKYNVNEYRELWNAVQELRARLNAEAGDFPPVSLFDIEKVAYVIRHVAVSGFAAGQPETQPKEPSERQLPTNKSQDTESSTKRKPKAEIGEAETGEKPAPRRESKRLKK